LLAKLFKLSGLLVYGGGAPGSLRDRFGAQFRVSLGR
jgi:hypothetical protein